METPPRARERCRATRAHRAHATKFYRCISQHTAIFNQAHQTREQPVFVQLFCGSPRSVCNKHLWEILKKASSNYPEVTLLFGTGLNNKQRQQNTNFLGFPPKICRASLRGRFNIFEIRVSVDHVGGQLWSSPPPPLFPVHLAAGGQSTARRNPGNLISIGDPNIGFE